MRTDFDIEFFINFVVFPKIASDRMHLKLEGVQSSDKLCSLIKNGNNSNPAIVNNGKMQTHQFGIFRAVFGFLSLLLLLLFDPFHMTELAKLIFAAEK